MTCTRCAGRLLVEVGPAYVERFAPGDLDALANEVALHDAALDLLDPDDPARRDLQEARARAYAAWRDLDSRKRQAAGHVYPCAECHPQLFHRWRAGCLRYGHRAADCERCLAVLGKKDAARHDRAGQR